MRNSRERVLNNTDLRSSDTNTSWNFPRTTPYNYPSRVNTRNIETHGEGEPPPFNYPSPNYSPPPISYNYPWPPNYYSPTPCPCPFPPSYYSYPTPYNYPSPNYCPAPTPYNLPSPVNTWNHFSPPSTPLNYPSPVHTRNNFPPPTPFDEMHNFEQHEIEERARLTSPEYRATWHIPQGNYNGVHELGPHQRPISIELEDPERIDPTTFESETLPNGEPEIANILHHASEVNNARQPEEQPEIIDLTDEADVEPLNNREPDGPQILDLRCLPQRSNSREAEIPVQDNNDQNNDQPNNDQAINDEAINNEAINDEAINDEAINDEAINDEAINNQAINNQAINNQAINNQAINDEAINNQAINDEAMNDQANREGLPNIGICYICWDDLGLNPLASTFCGHVFCLSCLETSLKYTNHCPTCRSILTGPIVMPPVAYHPLFVQVRTP